MHRTGTKHIIRHMQNSVKQWSVISKFTCIIPSTSTNPEILLAKKILKSMTNYTVYVVISDSFDTKRHMTKVSDSNIF